MTNLSLDTVAIGRPRRSVTSIMLHVVAALLPGIAYYVFLIDQRLLVNLLIAIGCAWLFEAILLMLRKRAVLTILKDASITLAAILLVLSVPQGLPTWQLIFGVFIMCALGKHVFGGLGHNPFNPAMVAYAVLIVSFPLTMTQWSSIHGIAEHSGQMHTQMQATDEQNWDSVTRATPLDRLDTAQRSASNTSSETEHDLAKKTSPGSVVTSMNNESSDSSSTDSVPMTSALAASIVTKSDWFGLSIAWAIGGIYLLLMGIISWRIPVSMLASVWCLYAIFGLASTAPMLPPTIALLSGAIMLGAFFIATDPVSAATSNSGKLVYGAGIGVFCFFIREFSAYPEGVAFAVLLMNMCVPLIDHAFTRNRLSAAAPVTNARNRPPS